MNVSWEQKQAELWERIFQATQDVVALADSAGDGHGVAICKTEMVKAAMSVGRHVVRGSASASSGVFEKSLEEARLAAVETDYWLRLLYLLQQAEEVQRDLSSVINQYSAIVELLSRLSRHGTQASVGKHERRRSQT